MRLTLIVLLGLLACVEASAQHRHFHPHYPHYRNHPNHGWVWVVPTVVGGIVTYELIKQQQPVIAQPPTKTLVCGPWIEREQDNKVVRERVCEER